MILNKSIRIILYIFYAIFVTYPSIAAEGGSGGMPQMVIPDFMPQLVWLFIVFPILYCSMKYLALPRITEIMANRDMKIRNNINKAEEIRNKIKEANQEHELAIKETNDQIKVLVSEISQKSITEAEQQIQECQNNINTKIKEEKLKLEKEISNFSKNIEKISNYAAESIIEKIYYEKPNKDNLKNIVSKYSESYKND
jgi:F-type H+-transporting ATPase subunit b